MEHLYSSSWLIFLVGTKIRMMIVVPPFNFAGAFVLTLQSLEFSAGV